MRRLIVLLLASCASTPKPEVSVEAEEPEAERPPQPSDAVGGLAYDRWYIDTPFKPDAKGTPGVADGLGGPFNDGTLADATGKPMLNDTGHDYRFKNFFGWDLRGAEGISGPKYQNKPFALAKNLLTDRRTAAELEAWLAKGGDGMPAYGGTAPPETLKALAAFLSKVQAGELPGPDAVWTLAPTAGFYALVPGGDAARGAELVKARCAKCHGKDGTKELFDDGAFSLGSFSRQKAYEGWMKILNGHPGSKMKRQVRGATAKEMGQELLDIHAALCDRTAFPVGPATGKDVADGDPRCGAYLK